MLIWADNDTLQKVDVTRKAMHDALLRCDTEEVVRLHEEATDLSFKIICDELDRVAKANGYAQEQIDTARTLGEGE